MSSSGIRVTGLSGIDTESMVKQLMNAERYKYNRVFQQNELLGYKQEAYRKVGNSLVEQQKKFGITSAGSFRLSSTWNKVSAEIKSKDGSSSNAFTVKSSSTDGITDFELGVASLATDSEVALDFGTNVKSSTSLKDALGEEGLKALREEFSIGSSSSNQKDIFADLDDDATIKDLVDAVNVSDSGFKATYSESLGKVYIEKKDGGAAEIHTSGLDAVTKAATDAGKTFESANNTGTKAVVWYNGERIEKDSNSFKLDGMQIDLKSTTMESDTAEAAKTDSKSVKLTQDNKGLKETLKGFVESFNAMLASIYDELSTDRPKSDSRTYYEPLTDEQKDAMSEDEIKKWEEKSKAGMLYGDESLNSIEDALRKAVNTSVTLSDGSKLSLAHLGISPEDYKDKGKLSINETKLDEAIEKYGDKLGEMFVSSGGGSYESRGIANRISDALNEAVGTNGSITKAAGLESQPISLATNELGDTIKDKERELEDIENWLAKKEQEYYVLFGSMETAVNQSNSQLNYLMSML
ncbi:MAG: flagellar filament capping protein FliD [Lachnospirales bacterium]